MNRALEVLKMMRQVAKLLAAIHTISKRSESQRECLLTYISREEVVIYSDPC